MDVLDRSVIIVLPREPVVDWVNEIDPDHPIWLEDISWRGNVYLIPHFEAMEDAEAHLETSYEEIFENELADWCPDKSKWPQERSFDLFLEWFDVIMDVVAFDMVKGQVRKLGSS